MKKNKLFKIVFVAFVLGILAILYDMARQTTAPWNKKKQLERAVETK
jgi:uncharacterized membrane protein YvbJ